MALIQSKLDAAKKILESQLNQLAKAAKSNADTYLATIKPGTRQVKRVDAKAVREMLTRTDQVIAKQIALIKRISIRREEGSPEKNRQR